jgi:hypothetical protein
LLHSCVSPARVASRSFLKPKAKLRIAEELDSSASFSHPSRFYSIESSYHLGELLGESSRVGEGFIRFARFLEVLFLLFAQSRFVAHEQWADHRRCAYSDYTPWRNHARRAGRCTSSRQVPRRCSHVRTPRSGFRDPSPSAAVGGQRRWSSCGASPYPTLQSLTVRPIHQECDRTRHYGEVSA